ncbi:ABC transporter permease [Pararhodonellum marinum]|uniref:ABC transporter permease n=1 Tax=Pararhodonellum marinum TaxID=2755358 RepID=UPI00188EBB03|nr:FtsX-like permease family protein [Pararhodonellum marinum]
MKFQLIFDIAKALLIARWKQTLVAAVGVTFSITMFVALLGFMNGLNNLLDGLILNRSPHVRFFNEIKPNPDQPIEGFYGEGMNIIRSIKPSGGLLKIHNGGAILENLKNDPRVLGVAPKISLQVFYNVGNIDITGVINGIDVQAERSLFAFEDYVTEGNAEDLENISNSIILGKGAADRMLANIGDVIQATTASGDRFRLRVVGYYQSGLQDLDNVQSYASISTAQKMLGEPSNYMTDIQVKLNDFDQSPAFAREMGPIFGTQAEDIQMANAQFETGSDIRNMISYAVGITLLIVSGFGIYNILNMMIYEKMDTIAILKAIGFSGLDVKGIFMTIAIGIGIFGGGIGLFLGYLLSMGIDQVPFETEALPTVKTFPVSYDPKYYIIGGVFSLLTTFLAGYLPARKASSIDPVEIIRGK